MKQPITLLDGAVGTSLWEKSVDKVPVWRYNIENPAIVTELHREFIAAGSKIILANTFGANAGAVGRSPYTVREVVSKGMRLAKDAVKGTDVKVALSAGPLTVLLEPYGDLTEEEASALYEEQIGAGMEEGPDVIMLQTFMDVHMMEVAARVAKRYGVPVFCTMTFEKVGKTMMGQSVQDVLDTLTPLGIDAVGLNCSLGPDLAVPIIREFHEKTDLPLIFKPNAGKPILSADGSTATAYDAGAFVDDLLPSLPYVRYLGGCCGSNAAYIARLHQKLCELGYC
jgi:5-methyltetrahydrofolate--homocysteine methyltransferase